MNDLPPPPNASSEFRALAHFPRLVRSVAWDSSMLSQRWHWLTPLILIMLFVCMMLSLLWVLRGNEISRQKAALIRDVEWTQQVQRLHLQAKRDELSSIARDIDQGELNETDFIAQTQRIMSANPEFVTLSWVDAQRIVRWRGKSGSFYSPTLDDSPALRSAYDSARTTRQPTFALPFLGDDGEHYTALQIPLYAQNAFRGTVTAVYSLNNLLRYVVPREISDKYRLEIRTEEGAQLALIAAGTFSQSDLHYELPLDPPGHGVLLRAYPYPSRSTLADNVLVWVVMLLSAIIMWSLWSLMRHTRRRLEAESARDRLFNLSLDILCVMDGNGLLLRLNPAFTRVLGADPATLRGTSVLELLHPDDRAATRAELRKLAAGEAGVSFENRCRRINDDASIEYRWLLWAFNPDPQPRSSNRMIYAVAHDVTERRTHAQALMTETAFRRAMEDSVLTGMRAFDLHGRITYVNPAFCRMSGWDEKDLIGTMPPYPYWPLGTHDQQSENLALILTGNTPTSGLEVRVRRKDGRTFDARMYVSPLIDAHGVQTGWMTSMTDITEPKRIREELAAAHHRFTTVLEELDAAVSVFGGEDQVLLFANRYYRRVLGNDATGHLELSFSSLQRDYFGEEAKTNELYSKLADKWFEVRQRTIQWVDGRMVQMQVATDISARKQADELARQQQEKVQLTSRLITMGEMASSLAHELNQPLTAIANYGMGCVAHVRSEIEGGVASDPHKQLQILQKTSAQAERAGKIIRRIREFVKRREPHKQRCSIRSIVDDAVGFAEIEASKQRIAIRTNVAPNIEDIDADPILIEQVLLNLLKNGAEAMVNAEAETKAPREVVLEVKDTGSHVEFAVTDRGPGIDPVAQSKLFEPFFSTKNEGMGMGLNICRSIVEFHHGRLWMENNQSGGCTFRFTLPKIAATPVASADIAPWRAPISLPEQKGCHALHPDAPRPTQ